MKKRYMLFVVMILTLVAVMSGCFKDRGKLSTLHGEDFLDNRESRWTFRDSNDDAVAKIKVKKGYTLSNQSYFTCNISAQTEDGDVLIAKVDAEAGLKEAEAIDLVRTNHTGGNINVKKEKDYTIVSVKGEQEEKTYMILTDGRNSVIILLEDDPNANKNERIHEIKDMIYFQ